MLPNAKTCTSGSVTETSEITLLAPMNEFPPCDPVAPLPKSTEPTVMEELGDAIGATES